MVWLITITTATDVHHFHGIGDPAELEWTLGAHFEEAYGISTIQVRP